MPDTCGTNPKDEDSQYQDLYRADTTVASSYKEARRSNGSDELIRQGWARAPLPSQRSSESDRRCLPKKHLNSGICKANGSSTGGEDKARGFGMHIRACNGCPSPASHFTIQHVHASHPSMFTARPLCSSDGTCATSKPLGNASLRPCLVSACSDGLIQHTGFTSRPPVDEQRMCTAEAAASSDPRPGAETAAACSWPVCLESTSWSCYGLLARCLCSRKAKTSPLRWRRRSLDTRMRQGR